MTLPEVPSFLTLPRLLTGESFASLRENPQRYLYVDKTMHIPALLAAGSPLFVRPRRFGKSTMLTAIYALLTGNRKAFEGLPLEKIWDWEQPTHPILRLDFSTGGLNDLRGGKIDLLRKISSSLKSKVKLQHGVESHTNHTSFSDLFEELLTGIYLKNQKETAAKGRVYILLDEYDFILQPYILNPQQGESLFIEEVLCDFFGAIKNAIKDGIVAGLVSTGICKVSGLNFYSALNFITDVSGNASLATMTGYTRQEILHYFQPFLESALQKNNCIAVDDLMEELAFRYNGYSFSPENLSQTVFNPYSVLHFFRTGIFQSYWFSSSIYALSTLPFRDQVEELLNGTHELIVDAGTLDAAKVLEFTIQQLLFFTGYMTLKKIQKGDTELLVLDWPNQEVSSRFSIWYAKVKTQLDMAIVTHFSHPMSRALLHLNVDSFCIELQMLIRSLAYTFSEKTPSEADFHMITDISLKISGMEFTLSEVMQAQGRIDLITYVGNYCYIFEFKVTDDESEIGINKKIQEIKKQVTSKQYSHGVPKIRKSSVPCQRCLIGLVFGKSRNLLAYSIIESPNKKVLPETDHLDIVERTAKLPLPHTYIQGMDTRQKLAYMEKVHYPNPDSHENSNEEEVDENQRFSKELSAMNDLYLKMIKLVEENAEIARIKAEAESKKLKLILRLKAKGNSSEDICSLMELSQEEWKELTGEDMSPNK